MIALVALVAGCGLHLLAGVAGLLGAGRLSAVLSVLAGAGLCLAGVLAIAAPSPVELRLPWPVPGGAVVLALDPLSGAFLLPVGVLGAAAAVFARGYWDAQPSAGRTRAATGVLLAAMALVLSARQGVFFLLAWEVMALAAWAGLSAEHGRREVREAGWLYLVFTHLGSACLGAMVVLLLLRGGSWDWAAQSGAAHPLDHAIFLLALAGFGAKAGLLPLHAWLPGAHAGAPSHVSALLSGCMLKMGVYGLLRVSGLLPAPAPWWGTLLVALGAVSALYGIASAALQADYKRLLACSSIEHLGIIAMALGLALLGRALGRPDLAVLAGAAAVLHTWHHAAFKGLLFCGAGAVLHATGTRRTDRLGGLLRRMPRAGALWILAAAAAAGLPGLAGFASEWPLFLAGFADLRAGGWAGAVVVVALALCGALAVVAYAGLLGGVLLGAPRGPEGVRAHDPGPGMLWPMGLLAAACLALGVAVPWTAGAAAAVAAGALRLPVAAGPVVPGLAWLAGGALVLVVAAGALWWWLGRLLARRPAGRGPTWDCGYAGPGPRMQYTAASFGATLGREIAPHPVAPLMRVEPARGLFPAAASLAVLAGDGILERWLRPLAGQGERLVQRLRLLQQGQVHAYLAYVLATVLALVAFAVLAGGG